MALFVGSHQNHPSPYAPNFAPRSCVAVQRVRSLESVQHSCSNRAARGGRYGRRNPVGRGRRALNDGQPAADGPPTPAGPVTTWVSDRMPKLANLTSWFMLTLVALIALGEVDRLISGALSDPEVTGAQLGHSLNTAIGPLALAETGAWAGWASNDLHPLVAAWMVVAVGIDGLLVLGYWKVLNPLIRSRATSEPGRHPASMYFLRGLVAVEILEAVLLIFGAWAIAVPDPISLAVGVISGVVAWVATVKWAMIVLLIVALLRNPGTGQAVRGVFRRLMQAVWLHRLSTVVMVLLIILACVPSDDILDQLPDIQRQWVGDEFLYGYVLFALLALALASVTAFVLGRNRTRRGIAAYVYETPTMSNELPKTLIWWLVPPVAGALVAGVIVVVNLATRSDVAAAFGWEWAPFLGVTVLVLGLSVCLNANVEWQNTPTADLGRARYAWIIGDLLAVLVLAVGGLGLVRSMTAPVMLLPGWSLSGWPWVTALALLVGGAALAVAAPQALRWLAPGVRLPTGSI